MKNVELASRRKPSRKVLAEKKLLAKMSKQAGLA